MASPAVATPAYKFAPMIAAGPSDPAAARVSAQDGVLIGIWAGLASGLLEAFITYSTRFSPNISAYRKSSELIFWVAPIAYAIVFAIVGGIATVILRPLLRHRTAAVVLAGLLTVGCYLGVSYPSRISPTSGLLLSAGLAVAIARAVVNREATFLSWLRRRLVRAVLVVVMVAGGVQLWISGRERVAISQLPAAKPGAPNVLIVIVDALRGDRLSSAGYPKPTTPHLDAFAREGIQYLQAFSTAPWSTPSHNSMLTGRYVFEHQMDYPVPNLHHGFPYLPAVLAQHGYRSALFSANVSAVVQEYLDAGFHHYDTYTPRTTWARTSLSRKLRRPSNGLMWFYEGTKPASTVVDPFLAWAQRDPSRPFFVVMNLMELHDRRFWQPAGLQAAARGDAPEGDERPEMRSKGGNRELMDRSYDEGVKASDAQVARLLDEMQRLGLTSNTITIVTADHGDSVGQHGFAAHASSVYIEQLWVPLLLRWPSKLQAGLQISEPVSLVNLPATLMQLLDLQGPFPGQPWPLAPRPPERGHRIQDSVLAEFNTVARHPFLQSLLNADWHYIANTKTGKEELFAWPTDQAELNDLAATPQAAPVLEAFRREMAVRLKSPDAARSGRR
jgi:arylsulfatase A-like enzyme